MPQVETTRSSTGIRLSVAPSTSVADVFVVRIDGTVDTLTADELDNVIGTLTRQKRLRLVIDLAGANYVSSAGWGIFISRLREIREGGGDLKLARMTPAVRDVYDLLELDGVLRHFDRLDAAESQFDGGQAPMTVSRPTREVLTENAAPIPDTPSAPTSLDDAIRHLIVEDPFYSVGELQHRLRETGAFRVGRWAILHTLWRLGLILRHQRFRYYRRHMHDHSGRR